MLECPHFSGPSHSCLNLIYYHYYVIDYIQTAIRENVVDSLLVEPVLGEGGYVVPPEGFLKALRKLCDENNIIMIVDEVQAGMGRTGKMWAFEHDGIKPDIVCAGKSVGGGIPMSLVYYRADFDEKLPTPFHLGTYRANPLALAAGKEVLKRTRAVLDSVKERGKDLLKAFSGIDSDVIAQVRGKGFMIGIELGKNGKPADSNTMARYRKLLIENGLVMHTCGHYGNTFSRYFPLSFTLSRTAGVLFSTSLPAASASGFAR